MNAQLHALWVALRDLEADASLPDEGTKPVYLTNGVSDELPQRIQGILVLADDALITQKGQPRYDAMRWLEERGFRVGPGEQDSFGWLTGVIYTRKGRVVYG